MSMESRFGRRALAERKRVIKTSTETLEVERYAYRPLKGNIDFSLEREALQHILDSVLRLQTYIALRERREGGGQA